MNYIKIIPHPAPYMTHIGCRRAKTSSNRPGYASPPVGGSVECTAEIKGVRNGLGFYVENYSDLGGYTRSIADVLVIVAVVTAITFLSNRLQRFLLR
jgi:hypothetical protein